MPVVSNSSPLILLARVGRLGLLREVFNEVLVPDAVWHEVVAQGAGRSGEVAVAGTPWIQRQSVLEKAPPMHALGAGEADAIALALNLGLPLLLDDRDARRVARARGLLVYGSGGVLILARDAGLLSLVRPVLDDLRAAGLYLSDGAYREILRAAGERVDAREGQ